MHFTITGKIKPYVRMTQRGKHSDPQAREYLASKEAIGWQLRQQMAGELMPARTPLKVVISFTMAGGLHKADLDNQAKAVIDAAQGIVYKNDCWVDEIVTRRKLGDTWLTELDVKTL